MSRKPKMNAAILGDVTPSVGDFVPADDGGLYLVQAVVRQGGRALAAIALADGSACLEGSEIPAVAHLITRNRQVSL